MEFLPVNSEDATPTENMTYEDVAPLAFPGKHSYLECLPLDSHPVHLFQDIAMGREKTDGLVEEAD